MTKPAFVDFDLTAGRIGALRWSGNPAAPTVLALHGITSNAWYFDPIAHQLAGDADVVAIDLRGRGRSFDHPGPFGLSLHADDVAAIAEQIDGPVVLVGHSMGAFVALMALGRHPALFDGVVLVDGGAARPPVAASDTEAALESLLGPGLRRLRTVWPDRVSYNTMWSQHPAFADGITIDLQRNLLADLVDAPNGFRVAVNEVAVRADGRDMLIDPGVRALLSGRLTSTTIVRAAHGLDGAPPPFISDAVVAELGQHDWLTVPDTNHYTVLLGATGARIVADALRRELRSA